MAFSLFGKKPPAKPGSPSASPDSAGPTQPLANTPPIDAPAEEDDGLASIELNLTAPQIDPLIERVVMLYASDQASVARATLEEAMHDGDTPETAWYMLFELYQIGGKFQAFEALALAYAAHFEKSPPTWEQSRAEVRDPALTTGGRAFMALKGKLDAKCDEMLKQLLRMAAGNQWVRLDLSRLADADNGGCALLLATLQRLKQDKRECVLNGADHLAGILRGKIASGRRDDEATWLMLLELYQRLFRQEAFEETALQYAVTFEVSPPSWEAPRPRPAAVAAAPPDDGGPRLAGEIVGAGGGTFAALLAAAEGSDETVVDASDLQRMDFVSAGMLLNVMLSLQAAGTQVRITGLSHLLAGLFAIVGIGQIAALETRNY